LEIQIVTPRHGRVLTGNRCTARQWAQLLRDLGHTVSVVHEAGVEQPDVLIALHAAQNHEAIRQAGPGTRTVVALTGTDLYPELGERALDSLQAADRIVALQARAKLRVPEAQRDKVHVIVQSAANDGTAQPRTRDPFQICVIGHLRRVKDPLRSAAAARLLPETSKIQIVHVGAILEPAYRELVEREMAQNPRYRWLDMTDPAGAQTVMAGSQLQVVSSYFEGGARVIGESLVVGTPVLAARNDASCCLLGEDYPGLYDAGNTNQLAELMERAETDEKFLLQLQERAAELAGQFNPLREREAWRELAAELEGLA
jgi:putative glycosyltransferase (TIGR04348 family)